MASTLLPIAALILVSGIGVQLLARRLMIPSVVFYLAIGFLLGPEVLGVVTLETFGDGLTTVVGLSVAIIVFDGAFALRIERIREASTASLRLVTIGAVIMFVGTTVAVRVLEGAAWEIALVIGALLVATGPTVITPILEVVKVREHVSAVLETEGIINDVTAAIAAVVIFETLLLDDLGVQSTVFAFVERLGIGVGAGLLATGLIYLILQYELSPEEGPQTARFLVFSAAIGSFALAEVFAAEAGVAAAATAGNEAASQLLLGTVFIVIVATDAVEAGLARQIGDVLGVTPMRTLIVGGGRVGLALATRLEQRGEFVVVVENDGDRQEKIRNDGLTVHNGDGTEVDVLRDAGIAEAKTVVATTDDDNANLLVCQTANTKFDIENVYARVNDSQNMAAFEALDVTAIDSPMATAFAIDNEIERPELAHWMYDLSDGHDIREVEMTAKGLVGESIRSLRDRIPGGCLIAEIGQGADAHVPDPDELLEYGDHITFLGDAEAVREAVELFHPRD